jgi:hypothetical protein
VQPRWLPSAPRSVNVTTPAHIPKSVAFFRRALIEALDARGKDMSPRAGMPQVKAVDREIVRAEFLKASGQKPQGQGNGVPALRDATNGNMLPMLPQGGAV